MLEPKLFLRELFDCAVTTADPMQVAARHLPPKPAGRTIVIGAVKGKVKAGLACDELKSFSPPAAANAGNAGDAGNFTDQRPVLHLPLDYWKPAHKAHARSGISVSVQAGLQTLLF